jgi:hypothetical protein
MFPPACARPVEREGVHGSATMKYLSATPALSTLHGGMFPLRFERMRVLFDSCWNPHRVLRRNTMPASRCSQLRLGPEPSAGLPANLAGRAGSWGSLPVAKLFEVSAAPGTGRRQDARALPPGDGVWPLGHCPAAADLQAQGAAEVYCGGLSGGVRLWSSNQGVPAGRSG